MQIKVGDIIRSRSGCVYEVLEVFQGTYGGQRLRLEVIKHITYPKGAVDIWTCDPIRMQVLDDLGKLLYLD